jgi:hypothetical protein
MGVPVDEMVVFIVSVGFNVVDIGFDIATP